MPLKRSARKLEQESVALVERIKAALGSTVADESHVTLNRHPSLCSGG